MRGLSAMVAALWLGACAAQPLQADLVAQIRGEGANLVARKKPSAQTAETHTQQPIVNTRSLVFNAPSPKLDGDQKAGVVLGGVPTLDIEAICRPSEILGVDRNVARCLSVESGARDQLARKWIEFPSADRSHCARYTTRGGGGTYTDLLTCLEMDLDASNLNAKNRSVANQPGLLLVDFPRAGR
jgi:hypothetical protein